MCEAAEAHHFHPGFNDLPLGKCHVINAERSPIQDYPSKKMGGNFRWICLTSNFGSVIKWSWMPASIALIHN